MMKLSLNDIYFYKENYSHLFNGFVLFFPFNRDFQSIQKLPKGFKYILLVNCFCNNTCQGDHHWYAVENGTFSCPNAKYLCNINCSIHEEIIPWHENSTIRPIDLDEFSTHIDVFKLQGGEFNTKTILTHLFLFNKDY